MKRRTAGAIVVTFACLTMLAISALSVKGCSTCFTPGTSWQPCGTYTPRVTPIPHDPPAEPLTPAEPAPEPIPEPEEPTEVEEPIAPEPLPPGAGPGTGSTPGPTTPEEVEPRPGPTVPPPGPIHLPAPIRMPGARGVAGAPRTWPDWACGCAEKQEDPIIRTWMVDDDDGKGCGQCPATGKENE